MDLESLTLDAHQEIDVQAAIGDVYEGLLRRLSDENSTPEGKPMPMVLERWPGGRWFRDLDHATGHLWAHVQVIKPPSLLELHGPLFMSYAATGHVQFRLTEQASGTRLTVRHRVIGMLDEKHREGLEMGWNSMLEAVKRRAEG